MEFHSRLSLPLAEEQLQSIVSTVFGTHEFRAARIEGGLFNTSYELYVESDRYILRVGPVNRQYLLPYEHHLMAAENYAYRQLRHAGIPTSEVVCCDTTKQLLDRDFMVVRASEGQMLSALGLTPEEKDAVYEQLGGYMAALHQIKEPMFGRLSEVLQGNGAYCWSEALLAMHRRWASTAAPTGCFEPALMEQAEQILIREQPLLDEIKTPMLTHCDLWENNVLAKRFENDIVITAIIDIDRAVCGDPAFEFGYEFMLTDAFKKGYGKFPTDPASVRRRHIYRMLCCLNDAYVWYGEYENVQYGDHCKADAIAAMQALTDV